ncbi:hypothetical protein C4797_11545 [Salmonella enterica subsp. enterica serovar Weslaco]|nr:hypothetical protein C4797_11545 [Salmonella enterica subsp. enterica serovar Weslaco]
MCWLRITRPIHGPRPDGPSHATFKSAPGRFVAHPSHIVIYAPGDSLPCRLYATRIILGIYSIMMIIAPSQIIIIINKSHYEINSIIRFLLPTRRILRAQAAPSAATDLTVTIPLKA